MINKKNQPIIWFFLSFLSLFIGGMIYIAWRPYTLKMFEWFSIIGLKNFILKIRDIFSVARVFLPSWFIYSLPQALWCLCGFFFVHGIWMNIFSYGEQIWLGVILCIGVSFEIFQFLKIIPGHFDFIDLLWILIFYFFSLFLFYIFRNNIYNGGKE